jgi:molybdate transport system regulatory protein
MLKDQIALGPGKADLLEEIRKTGSIREAAQNLGMSYMRAWKLVKTINGCFREALVISERGGKEKGGARLTRSGVRVIGVYRRMERKALNGTSKDWKELCGLLKGSGKVR